MMLTRLASLSTGPSYGVAVRRDAWDDNSVRSDVAIVGVFQRRVGVTYAVRTTSRVLV